MNDTMVIRNGFDLGITEVFELISSVYNSTDVFASDFEEEYPSAEVMAGRLDDIRRRPGSLFLVTTGNNGPDGYILVVPRTSRKLRHTADINMGVMKAARGRGTGKFLLCEAISRTLECGVLDILYLMVRADNQPAIELYCSQGFKELARLERDIKAGPEYHDGILMSLFIGNHVLKQ